MEGMPVCTRSDLAASSGRNKRRRHHCKISLDIILSACYTTRQTRIITLKMHGQRYGQHFIGQKIVDVPMPGDPMGWPILWTSPSSLSPPTAVERAKDECDLSHSFLDAIWISSGTLCGWLIHTDGPHLFWSGKNREGFRLRQEPSITD